MPLAKRSEMVFRKTLCRIARIWSAIVVIEAVVNILGVQGDSSGHRNGGNYQSIDGEALNAGYPDVATKDSPAFNEDVILPQAKEDLDYQRFRSFVTGQGRLGNAIATEQDKKDLEEKKRTPSSSRLRYRGLGKRRSSSSNAVRFGGLGKRRSDFARLQEGEYHVDEDHSFLDRPSEAWNTGVPETLEARYDGVDQLVDPAFYPRRSRSKAGPGLRYSGLGKRRR